MSARDELSSLNERVNAESFQNALKARRAMMHTAGMYYDGLHPRALKIEPNQPDFNTLINQCRKVVDQSVAWMFGDAQRGFMLQMELRGELANEVGDLTGEAVDEQAVRQQAFIEAAWSASGGANVLLGMGREASIAGHGFIRILPVGHPHNQTELPLIVIAESDSIFVVTDELNKRAVHAYVSEWQMTQKVEGRKREVVYRHFVFRFEGAWYLAQMNDSGKRGAWFVEQEPEVWPFDWSPVIDWRNLEPRRGYYGLSDLEDLTILNDRINFTASNVNKILFYHAHPSTVLTGADADDLVPTAVNRLWSIPSTEAKVTNLEMHSDLQASFNFLQFLSRSFFGVARELDIGTLQDRIGQITNFGLKVLAAEALAKLGEKRLNYGQAIQQVNLALQELGGFKPLETIVHWKDPLPLNAVENVKRLREEADLGVTSRETAAAELGRDWQTEQERMAAEEARRRGVGGELLARMFDRGETFEQLETP